jgi:hypothetical protein
MANKDGFSADDLREIESQSITTPPAATPGMVGTFEAEFPVSPAEEAPAAAARPTTSPGSGFSTEDLTEVLRSSQPEVTEITPTAAEVTREGLIGGPQGVKQGALTLPPAVAGARVGAIAGAPFFPPYGAVAGGTIGFFGGLTLGTIADQALDDFFPLPAREDLVPYREGAKTTGAVIGGAPAVFGIPEMTANMVARWLSGVASAARKYPRGYLTGEAVMGVGSGIGGGVAVAYDPDSPWTRFFGEVAGGVATSPASLLASQTGAAKNFLTDFSKSFSSGAREQKAANILIAGLTEAGEDPAKLIAFLNSSAAKDAIRIANPTAAQLTGSPLLTRLETSLSKNHPTYKDKIDKQGKGALEAYQLLFQRLKEIGTPEAVQLAAAAQRDYFMKMTNDRIDLAMKNAAEKIGKISPDTPASRREIGEVIKQATLDALDDARDMEKDLWTKAARDAFTVKRTGEVVPKSVRPAKLTEDFMYILDGMTPERYSKDFSATLSPIMQRLGYENRFYDRFVQGKRTEEFLRTGRVPEQFLMAPKKKTANVEDLIQVRSDLLEYARKASRAGDTNDARIYGQLAEAVLDDLSSLNTEGYRVARQYSKDLNDYFTRSYARELRATTGAGAEKIPAEVLVSRVYGANADMTAMRMTQIEDSVGFMRSQYDKLAASLQDPNLPPGERSRISGILTTMEPFAKLADERVTSMRDAQTRVLRLAASNAVDPTTGRLNVGRLNKFVNDNEVMLRRMNILDDLVDAEKAENLFKQTSNLYSKVNEKLIKQAAFTNVLDAGQKNPSLAVANAINSKTPLASFNKLVSLARRADAESGNKNATDGLKSMVYDYAFTKAGGMGNFSPEVFEKAFFDPLAPNKPSLVKVLRAQNVMDFSEVKNLKRLIDPMKRVEAGLLRQESIDNLVAGADPITDLALRIVGSQIGTSLAPGGPGTLIAAAAGSKAVRTIFDKYPNMSITKIIEDATKDPILMRDLLQKGKAVTPKQRVELGRRLHNYLFTAGYNAGTFDEEELMLEVPETRTTGPSAAQMLRQIPKAAPPAPPTRGVPGLVPQQPPAGGPPSPTASQAAGGAPSNSRAMFQTLFPLDTVSPLLNQPR